MAKLVKQSELQQGDVVNLEHGVDSLGDIAIVQRIKDGQVYLARPWLDPHNALDSNSGYLRIGVEFFSVFADSDRTMLLIRRDDKVPQ